MVNLVSQTPCHGLLPTAHSGMVLREITPRHIWSVAPYAGQQKAVSDALKAQIGVGLPAPLRMVSKGDIRALWFAQGQALVMDADIPDLSAIAAVTDQSDAWAIVEIDGAGVTDVLARLTPVDVAAMKSGHTARTLVGHMTASVTRTGANTFMLIVMRSMARTLIHDLDVAMKSVAARSTA